jgi:hypothetical protein
MDSETNTGASQTKADAQTASRLLATLTDVDNLTQGHAAAIGAAARSMLALDAHKLLDVRTLLGVIIDRAQDLANCTNCMAEEAGANSIDEREREIAAQLWEQHHALHGDPCARALAQAARAEQAETDDPQSPPPPLRLV